MTLHDVALDDKFDLSKERVFLSGAQAIVRMLLIQRERDRRAGLTTAGFVSGYRGSPLGGLDQQLWKARSKLARSPTSSSSPASTRNWPPPPAGARSRPSCSARARKDGVFSLWYGKGPGVDRSGDVFRHANLAGTSPHGGVLALMGDDHMAESSTNAHATEFLFVDTMIPILNPAGVQELIDYGLYGFALSRFAGTWAAIKCVKDNIESTASVDASPDRLDIGCPSSTCRPAGCTIRTRDRPARPGGAAARIQARRGRRLHPRQRASTGSSTPAAPAPKLGIITVGKSYLDVRQALDDLGIDEARANQIGIRLFKVGCPWPLDIEHIADFVRGLETVVVVEEKRSLIEVQVKEALYGTAQPADRGRQEGRARRLAVPGQGRRSTPTTSPSRSASASCAPSAIPRRSPRGSAQLQQFQAMLADTRDVARARPSSARAVRTTARPRCRRARSRPPESAAISWPCGWTATPAASPRWAARARSGSARRPSSSAITSSRISATAPTTIPAAWRCASPRLVERQHHLQDPVQRRRGDDRRPAARGRPDGRRDRQPGARRGHRAHRHRQRRARQICRRSAQFPAGATVHHRDDTRRRAARTARGQGRLGADLRPDLRGREAPPPQARHLSRTPTSASSSTNWSARAAATAASSRTASRSSRSRPSSAASAASTSRAATRISPASTASARPSSRCMARKLRKAEGKAGAADPLEGVPEPSTLRARPGRLGRHHRRRRRHGRRHGRRDPRHGRASAGLGLRHDRHGGPRPEGRRGVHPCPHRRHAGRHPRHPRLRRQGRPRARLRPRRLRREARCWPRCARATRSSSPTRPRSCPASSRARPISRCRPSG